MGCGCNSTVCSCEDITLPTGEQGYNGWSPILANIEDDVNLDDDGNFREVHQIIGWTGGSGPVPSTFLNYYIGVTGPVIDIANGVNIRGSKGPNGGSSFDGVMYINNTPITNSADTSKNILDSFTVPANTLTNNNDCLEIEVYFKKADIADPSCTVFIDTPNFTTGQAMGASCGRLIYTLRIIRISSTTYTRYASFSSDIATFAPTIVTHNIACDFTNTFLINFAIQNVSATLNNIYEFSKVVLIRKYN